MIFHANDHRMCVFFLFFFAIKYKYSSIFHSNAHENLKNRILISRTWGDLSSKLSSDLSMHLLEWSNEELNLTSSSFSFLSFLFQRNLFSNIRVDFFTYTPSLSQIRKEYSTPILLHCCVLHNPIIALFVLYTLLMKMNCNSIVVEDWRTNNRIDMNLKYSR